jgi:hypothetical protein
MDVRAAKDLLVQQIAEQASLEHVTLSDLEKRMLYFTESGDCQEDPIALNAAFEDEYDTDEYEKKISGLARRTYSRLTKENPFSARTWEEAVQELRKGDHYLSILVDHALIDGTPTQGLFGWSFWKLLGIALLILIVGMVVFVVIIHNAESGQPAD